MSLSFSIYLEIVRIFATAIVFFGHSKIFYKPIYDFCELYNPGRDGVIIFFVLSGFVISWCAENKDKVFSRYVVSRASRIYSVAAPAIVLGFFSSFLISLVNDSDVPYQFNKIWLYVPVYLSFIGGFWSLSEVPPSNFPYWSLNYEVWYYILFSVLFFFKSNWKWLIVILMLCMMGPGIISMFPIWLLGSALYFHFSKIRIKRFWARLFLGLSLICFVFVKFYHVDNRVDELASFVKLGDFLIGFIVFMNFIFALNSDIVFSDRLAKVIRNLASFSFSFYLFHMPLFELEKAFVKSDNNPIAVYLAVVLFSILTIVFLAKYTEHKKKYLVVFFSKFIGRKE